MLNITCFLPIITNILLDTLKCQVNCFIMQSSALFPLYVCLIAGLGTGVLESASQPAVVQHYTNQQLAVLNPPMTLLHHQTPSTLLISLHPAIKRIPIEIVNTLPTFLGPSLHPVLIPHSPALDHVLCLSGPCFQISLQPQQYPQGTVSRNISALDPAIQRLAKHIGPPHQRSPQRSM